ncbi:MAG: DUF1569 domain-containing protein [Pseudomonadota bacterium]
MTGAPYLIRKAEGPLPVAALIERLAVLDPERASYSAPWSLARTFHHLAQGVEFSLSGYPQLKPRIFRATLGRGAFHLFHRKGAMRHATDAVIPGEMVEDGDPKNARDRLVSALQAFDAADAFTAFCLWAAFQAAICRRAFHACRRSSERLPCLTIRPAARRPA